MDCDNPRSRSTNKESKIHVRLQHCEATMNPKQDCPGSSPCSEKSQSVWGASRIRTLPFLFVGSRYGVGDPRPDHANYKAEPR